MPLKKYYNFNYKNNYEIFASKYQLLEPIYAKRKIIKKS